MSKRPWSPRRKEFEEAAVAVLQKARRPLTIAEIVERMTSMGLVEPSGKTPQNSMSNTIRRANERCREAGELPRFIATRDGASVRYSLG